MKKYLVILFTVSLALLFCGCVNRVGDFTVLSTKNVPYKFVTLGQGEGKDISHIIIIIPTNAAPNVKEAVDRAIDSRNGDLLLNASIYTRGWYIPYVYGQMGYVAKGYVADTTKER